MQDVFVWNKRPWSDTRETHTSCSYLEKLNATIDQSESSIPESCAINANKNNHVK